MQRWIVLLACLFFVWLPTRIDAQQSNLVARIHVDQAGVELWRVNTAAWVPIKIESLVGVGDSIRTTDKGQATIVFFDGTLGLQLNASSEAKLMEFRGNSEAFDLQIAHVKGFASQITRRTLTEKMNYTIHLPTFDLTLVQGELQTRVENSQRSAALNLVGGKSTIKYGDHTEHLSVQTGFRLAVGETENEIIHATSFPTLDSGLDGCPSKITLSGDYLLNVRRGADLQYDRIGGLLTGSTIQAMGISAQNSWYRIRYENGFGWIKINQLPLDKSCAGLRIFPDKFGPEKVLEASQMNATATPAP